ncbi:unnamed protein product [Ilex paraguariensis]|uniref:Uncharacterized protein n=1 Tax=Ilex paraguariensis TaxID=185542 RepID=A0ABC8SJB5_9AQUA
MATSAFKSGSKRGGSSENFNSNSNSSSKIPSRRRSLSVSAVSRTQSGEFSNKRDNPLFWSSTSPPDQEIEPDPGKVDKSAAKSSKISGLTTKDASVGERGRSAKRNSGAGSEKGIGRSLSRVRGRSVSRGHYGNSESEVEQESGILSNYRNRNDLNLASNNAREVNAVRTGADGPTQMNNSEIQSSQHTSFLGSDDSASTLQIPYWEDRISTGSLSEAEEKTIKAVFEQMKVRCMFCFGPRPAIWGKM